MRLHFLFGAAGAERSKELRRRLIRSADARPNIRHILLVPEQFTLQTQRNIVAEHPRHAVMNIDVLSFERLAHRVFGELGDQPEILTETGKMMLMRRAAGQHSEELEVFGRCLKRPGFLRRLMAMLSEFYQYGITGEELEEMSRSLAGDPLLARKLTELNVLYGALNQIRGEKVAAEEILPILSRRLPASQFARQAVIAVDGFTGFTSVQMSILEELLNQSESMTVSLLLPEEAEQEEAIRETDLFYLSRMTEAALTHQAAESHCPVSREFLEDSEEFQKKSDLVYLSRHFLQYGEKERFGGKPEHIHVAVSRSPQEEAEWAARETERLMRENGLRCREIAVVTGDMETYRPYLVRAFRRSGIPVFCDRRKGLMGNILVEYVRSALEVVERDFSYNSVFRHLRCGICRIEPEDLDRLDNYVLAEGLHGKKRWEEDFIRNPDPSAETDLKELNASRQEVMRDLQPLLSLPGHAKVAMRTAAIREMTGKSPAQERLEELGALLRKSGDAESAAENEGIMDYLMDLLDQMDRLLGEEVCSRQEFAEILDAGFSEAKIGMIPTGLDQVTIGDVRRSRQTDVRVLFVLGMNDGVIPGTVGEGGILTERERGMLAAHHLEIAPTAEKVAEQDRFYLYSLMTLPKERLYLSLSRMQMDGTAMRPSYLLSQLQGLFPQIPIAETEKQSWEERITGEPSSWDTMAAALPAEGSEENPQLRDFARALQQTPGGPEHFRKLAETAFHVYRGDRLKKKTAEELYGQTITGSVTRLEAYAGCPARQFYEGGLRLKERKTADFTRAGEGSFLHAILERFFRCLQEEQIAAGDLTEEKREELISRAVQEAASDAPYSLPPDDAGGRFLRSRLERLAGDTAAILCRQLAGGSYLPAAFELHFDESRSGTSGTELSGGRRMNLRGTIDRVDCRMKDGICCVRVIDYKTGKKTLSLEEICDGLSLQLPVYLDAACELWQLRHPDLTIVPAGMYYYQVTIPVLEEDQARTEEDLQKNMLRHTLLKGIRGDETAEGDEQSDVSTRTSHASRQQLTHLFHHTRRTIQRFGEEILDGEISASPVRRSRNSTACDYCPFRGTCGFDALVAGCGYRELPGRKEEEIWEIFAEEDEDQEDDE